jgi:hypothetical protein
MIRCPHAHRHAGWTVRGIARETRPLPERREVTGRDAYIIVEALTFSVEALGKLPIEGGSMAFLRRPLPQVPPPSAAQRSASPGDWTRNREFPRIGHDEGRVRC